MPDNQQFEPSATVIRRRDGAIGKVTSIDPETGLVVVEWSVPDSERRSVTYEDPQDLVAASLFERIARRLVMLVRG